MVLENPGGLPLEAVLHPIARHEDREVLSETGREVPARGALAQEARLYLVRTVMCPADILLVDDQGVAATDFLGETDLVRDRVRRDEESARAHP